MQQVQISNLTADPELRFTPSGAAVVSLRVACNDRYQDAQGQWVDADPTFVNVSAWRGLAENVAESLHKGDQVVVVGVLQGRTWESEDHERRSANDVTASYVGAGLSYGTATVARKPRKGGE